MLSIESYDTEICKATPEEQAAWAKLMSEHYSTKEEKYSPEYFLNYVAEKGKRICELSDMLEKPLNNFFKELEEKDLLDLEGFYENSDKGTPEINEHLLRLAKGDPQAIKKEEEIAERLAKEDFSDLEKELKDMGVL